MNNGPKQKAEQGGGGRGKRDNGKEGVMGRAGLQESSAQVSLSDSALRFTLDWLAGWLAARRWGRRHPAGSCAGSSSAAVIDICM